MSEQLLVASQTGSDLPPSEPASDGGSRSVAARLRSRPQFWAAAAVCLLVILMAIVPQAFAGWFGHGNPRQCDLAHSGAGPASGHPFGYDIQGCDIYANVIYGARNSISIGILVTAISFSVAVALGGLAGYYGKVMDAVVSRIADIFFGFPFVLGAIVILSTFHFRNVLSVSLTLAMFTWPVLMRLMRSSVMQVKQSGYILGVRSLGASDRRVLWRHIVPNSIAPVIVISAVTVGTVIAAEAALTFLGVGLQYPAISWGLQLANAQQGFQRYPHLLVFPGLFLSATVLSFVILGDVLQDAMDPRR